MKCPFCGNENKNTNIKCEVCGEIIHPEEKSNVQSAGQKINISGKKIGCFSNIILTVVLIPWILAGLAFIGVSLYSIINNAKISKDFEVTEGILVDYVVKRADDGKESYKAIYEFEVDGVKYTASPDKEGSKNGFKKKAKVKYNPESPNENLMASGWGGLLATGIIMEMVIAVIVIIVKRKIKMFSESIIDMKTDN